MLLLDIVLLLPASKEAKQYSRRGGRVLHRRAGALPAAGIRTAPWFRRGRQVTYGKGRPKGPTARTHHRVRETGHAEADGGG